MAPIGAVYRSTRIEVLAHEVSSVGVRVRVGYDDDVGADNRLVGESRAGVPGMEGLRD